MSLSSLSLSHTLDLLAGRLHLPAPPTGAFVDAPFTRHGGVMGYERRSPRDHRAGFDVDRGKFRVTADEPFRLDDGRLVEHVHRMAAAQGPTTGPMRVMALGPDRVLALAERPPLAAQGAAHMLGRSWHVLPDGLVVELTYYLDPIGLATHGSEEAWQLVIGMARAASPGPRRYRRGPATLELATMDLAKVDRATPGAEPIATLTLGPDWIPTLDVGADFAVHRLVRAVPYGVNDDPRLMIYLGRHPSAQPPPGATPTTVRIFDADAAGHSVASVQGGRTVRSEEAIAAVPGASSLCHVSMTAETEQDLAAMRAMVRSLAPTRRVAAPAASPTPVASPAPAASAPPAAARAPAAAAESPLHLEIQRAADLAIGPSPFLRAPAPPVASPAASPSAASPPAASPPAASPPAASPPAAPSPAASSPAMIASTPSAQPAPGKGVDFDALIGLAYPGGNMGPRPALDALWIALFSLPEWHFAVHAQRPLQPLIHAIDGKPWVYAFTDAARAARFYAENPGATGGAHTLSLAMPTEGARRWIREAGTRGLFGVQVNFGQPGCFSPCAGLDAVHGHLVKTGRLRA